MFGACMKGKKTKVCCCVPLAVAGLGVSVVLIVVNLATFIDQLRAVLDSQPKQASQIVSLIFCALPLLCAFLSVLGILCKKASLVSLAVSCIMPSIILIIVAIITLWIGICQEGGDTGSYSFLSWLKVEGENKKYVRGSIATGLGCILIILLCYVGDIYKSIATMLAKQQNIWSIGGGTKVSRQPLSSEAAV